MDTSEGGTPACSSLPPSSDWATDGVLWAHARVLCATIATLQDHTESAGVFQLPSGRVLIHVCTMGVVVGITHKENNVLLEIDDGTARVRACLWREPQFEDAIRKLDRGVLVEVRGRLRRFYEHRQINVHTIHIHVDPNAEALHWLDATRLFRTVYSAPPPPSSLSAACAATQNTTETSATLADRATFDRGSQDVLDILMNAGPDGRSFAQLVAGVGGDRSHATSVVRSALSALEQAGAAIVVDADTAHERHAACAVAGVLDNIIVKLVRKYCADGRFVDSKGVAALLRRSQPALAKITVCDVQAACERLVDSSDLYTDGEGGMRPVDA